MIARQAPPSTTMIKTIETDTRVIVEFENAYCVTKEEIKDTLRRVLREPDTLHYANFKISKEDFASLEEALNDVTNDEVLTGQILDSTFEYVNGEDCWEMYLCYFKKPKIDDVVENSISNVTLSIDITGEEFSIEVEEINCLDDVVSF